VLPVVLAITALRLLWLATNQPPLYADEAQYWAWAQDLRLGYFTKPPLIAWLIAGSTNLCGNTEGCVRLTSPLLHGATALLLGAAATKLVDKPTGTWSGILYATLPAVSVSATIVSTDVPLLTAWAAGLFALAALRETPTERNLGWWLLLGAALGVGTLAKYAMAAFLLSLALWLAIDRSARALFRGPGPWIALAAAALILAPNLAWNLSNDFATIGHVGANANLSAGLALDPVKALEFLGAQAGIAGPIVFALAAWLLVPRLRTTLSDPRGRFLAAFTIPLLLIMTTQGFLSRANANWAAPAWLSGVILVAWWATTHSRTVLLRASVALHLVLAAVVFGLPPAAQAAGIGLPRYLDPFARMRGFDTAGDAISRIVQDRPGTPLLFEQRRDMANFLYYIRPHPLDARMWEPDGIAHNEFELTAALQAGDTRSFLLVTRREDPADLVSRFITRTRVARILVPTHPNATLRYYVWELGGFQGYRD